MDRERLDGITLKYNAPVTLTLALLAMLALALGELTNGWTTQNLFSFYKSSPSDYLTYPRAILHVLGSTDLTVCTANIILLLVIGAAAEERFGSAKVLTAVLITAVVCALIVWLRYPDSSIMGMRSLLFMLMVLAGFACAGRGSVPITLLLILLLFIGREVVEIVSNGINLQTLTDIVGGAVGAMLGLAFSRGGGE